MEMEIKIFCKIICYSYDSGILYFLFTADLL